jgi:hypothetical protein
MRKCTVLALVFVFVVLSSLMVCTVKPGNAQKPSPPSVPAFSVKLVSHPYNVPPTTTSTFNSSTWKEITTTVPGYRVENKSIEITVKNPSFTPYTITTSGRDYDVKLDYLVEVKDHFDNDQSWKKINFSIQSTSQYTVLTCTQRNLILGTGLDINDLPVGSQLDFRVQARIGCWAALTQMDYISGIREPFLTEAELSGWSNTQTVTITNGSSSSTSSQTAPPQNSTASPVNNQPQASEQTQQSEQNQLPDFMFNPFFLFGVGALFAGVVIVVVLVVLRRYLKTSTLGVNGLYA